MKDKTAFRESSLKMQETKTQSYLVLILVTRNVAGKTFMHRIVGNQHSVADDHRLPMRHRLNILHSHRLNSTQSRKHLWYRPHITEKEVTQTMGCRQLKWPLRFHLSTKLQCPLCTISSRCLDYQNHSGDQFTLR